MRIINKKNTILFSVLLLLIAVFFLLQWYAKSYVKNLIEQKTPATFMVKYSDLDMNLFLGNITLYDAIVQIKSEDSTQYYTSLKAETIGIKGIGYWNILFNEKLSIANMALKSPILKYYPYKKSISKKEDTISKKEKIKSITIDKLELINGNANVIKKGLDSVESSLSAFDFKLLNTKINLQSTEKVFLTYERFQLNAKDIILANSDYEKITIDSIFSNKLALNITDFKITSKYNKKELSKHLRKERDYINLKIPQIKLDTLNFNFNKERFKVSLALAELVTPNLEIYRDKLVADDPTIKSLYSKSLRKLNFDLNINQVKIKNGYISYAELVDPNNKAGKLFFDGVFASLYYISNLKNAKKTEIKIKSNLMGTAPLLLNWSYDVNDTTDSFAVDGAINNLEAQVLNPFFKPNLNALAEGTLQQMTFNFYGNNVTSKGNMKMKYEDFNFKILRKDSSKVNKFLTAIGNLFIHSDSKKKPQDIRKGDIKAERDATKSFFNYLWINVKSGVISVLTAGDKK